MYVELYTVINSEGNYLALSSDHGTTWTKNICEAFFTLNLNILETYIMEGERIVPVTLIVEE